MFGPSDSQSEAASLPESVTLSTLRKPRLTLWNVTAIKAVSNVRLKNVLGMQSERVGDSVSRPVELDGYLTKQRVRRIILWDKDLFVPMGSGFSVQNVFQKEYVQRPQEGQYFRLFLFRMILVHRTKGYSMVNHHRFGNSISQLTNATHFTRCVVCIHVWRINMRLAGRVCETMTSEGRWTPINFTYSGY